jgi:predicted kinase
VADQTRAVVVEIDALRTSIDGWQDDDSTKLEARRLALEVADAHLRGGYDVLVPQYLGRTEFIEELERSARDADAAFVEILLQATEDQVVARFEARRGELGGADHPQHEVDDIRAAVADAIGRLDLVARARPRAVALTAQDDVDATLAALVAILEGWP